MHTVHIKYVSSDSVCNIDPNLNSKQQSIRSPYMSHNIEANRDHSEYPSIKSLFYVRRFVVVKSSTDEVPVF